MSDAAVATYSSQTVDDFIVTTNSPDPAPEVPAAPRDERGRFASSKADAPEPEPEADPADEAPEDEQPEAAKADPAPQKPPKRSLNRMIWEREEAQRKAQAAEERAARLEAELQEARKPRPDPPRESPTRAASTPQGEKFTYRSFDAWASENPDGTYEEYIEERAVARIEHKREQERRAESEREEITRLRTWGAAHQAREIEARRLYPDYDQRLSEGQQALSAAGFVNLPPALGRAILESERSAQIAYDLGTHPEVALQLARESAGLPESAAPWVRRVLEGRLSAASSGSAEQPHVTSKAKPVIKPVTGTPAATDPDDDGDDVPIEKWIASQNARDRKAGRL